MRELLAESPVSTDRNLWLVVPDAWPDGLRVVWLVLGKTPDDFHSLTIPIGAGQMPVVADALSRRSPVTERCDTCRLWRRLTEDSGSCHALAPQPVLYDPGALLVQLPAGGIRVAWPRTAPEDYCGEWGPLPVRPQRPDRPRKVCLCGSTRFYAAFQEANYRETMAGKIVLSVGFYPRTEKRLVTVDGCMGPQEALVPVEHGSHVGCTPAEKAALDELHLRKIDDADEVLVLNVGRYVGDSTRREIAYAEGTGKPVRYLEPPEGGPNP